MKKIFVYSGIIALLLSGCSKKSVQVEDLDNIITPTQRDAYVADMHDFGDGEIITPEKDKILYTINSYDYKKAVMHVEASDLGSVEMENYYFMNDDNFLGFVNKPSSFEITKAQYDVVSGKWEFTSAITKDNGKTNTKEEFSASGVSGVVGYLVGDYTGEFDNMNYLGYKDGKHYLSGYDNYTKRYALVLMDVDEDNIYDWDTQVLEIFSDSGNFDEISTDKYLVMRLTFYTDKTENVTKVIERYFKSYKKNMLMKEAKKFFSDF